MDILCLDSQPTLFGVFDLSIAPPLLFYSYIPIIFVSLLFGLYILVKDRGSLQSILVFGISTSFVLWVLNILIQWVAGPAALVHFGWQMTAIFEVLIFVLSAYLCLVFINSGKDIGINSKILLSIPILTVALLLPTKFNVGMFDLVNCESYVGGLWTIIYAFELLTIVGLLVYGFIKIRSQEQQQKGQSTFIVSGVALFLLIFSLSNIYGEITQVYTINLIGPIGMVAFLSLLTYTIMRFKTFRLKVFAAQALVFALIILVSALLFISTIEYVRIITSVTIVVSVLLGISLIRNVRKEIESREKIERLAKDLRKANDRLKELDKQKTEFISFATHQLRSPLTAVRGAASLILEGDLGPITDPIKNAIQTIYTSIKTQISVVEDYLNVSRIELGTMKYDLVEMDFKDVLKEVVSEQKTNIEEKGLRIEMALDEGASYKISADKDKFKQVIMNTIDNSVKYTPSGSISISLSKDDSKKTITLKVADTGVGIKSDVLPKLFQKFSRAPHASEANIHGTGLGLFIAKEIMNAHKGRIWAESEGEGKGSRFYIELPEIK